MGTDISLRQHYVTERGIMSSVWDLISQWGSTMWPREVPGQVSGNRYLSEAALCDQERYQVKCLGTDISVRQHNVTENGIRSSVWELMSQWGSTMWPRMVSGQVSGNWYLSEAALCDLERYQVKCLGTDISVRQHCVTENCIRSSVWELISQWGSTMWPREVSGQVSGNWYLSEAALCDRELYQVKCLGTDISVRQHYVTERGIRSSVWELISQWGSTVWLRIV